jgi:hypothetical protein
MTAFVKIEDGIVVQKQPYADDGFVEADDTVVCGMTYDGDEFASPVIEPLPTQPEIIRKRDFLIRLDAFGNLDAFVEAVNQAHTLDREIYYAEPTFTADREDPIFSFVYNTLTRLLTPADANEQQITVAQDDALLLLVPPA